MEYSTILKTTTKLLPALILSVNASIAYSAGSIRKQIAADAHPLAKIVVHVSQVGPAVGAGNGFVVGDDGCHILTNFHVAFGKGKLADGSMVFVENPATGHPVEIKADLKTDGTFGRKIKGRVVEFGNYDGDDFFGRSNDLAMIKLDDCLGKSYGMARFEMPARKGEVPQTLISTISLSQIDSTKSALYVEADCYAAAKTPVAGLFFQSCEALPGMSGSPIFRNDADGGYTIVGISTGAIHMTGKPTIRYAISSTNMTPFVQVYLGAAPLRSHQRK